MNATKTMIKGDLKLEIVEHIILKNYWEYYIAQQWCWDDFGPSINLDILEELKRTNREMNQIWTFQPKTNMYPCRIYLKGDKELELFLLKWG